MSSKADDFDVRYRDDRDDRAWGDGADGDFASGGYGAGTHAGNDHGAAGGTVDYDLGYDANGWDTQGFRSPTAGYLDNHETAQPGDADGGVGTAGRPRHSRETGRDDAQANGYGPAHGYGNGRGGSHARTAGVSQADTQAWAPEVPGSAGPWLPDQTGQTGQLNQPGRRAGPQGPGGP